MPRILVIGCGYSGERIARRHLARGDAVTAVTRDPARGRQLRAAGAQVLALDLDTPGFTLPAADRAYYLAPPPPAGTTDPRLARALGVLPPQALIYASTTGVYGDHKGQAVNEDTSPAPGNDRARRRLDAEQQARRFGERAGLPVAILRVAAIYGPGRLPLAALAAGDPVPDDSGPGNRIHVEDLAAAAVAIADLEETGTWNISDGNPLPSAAFADLVADLAGLPRPGRVPANSEALSAGRRAFLAESRRVDNARLLAVPGFCLQFADPANGVRASLPK